MRRVRALLLGGTSLAIAPAAWPANAATTQLLSVNSGGQEGNAPSGQPSISGNGRLVAFLSNATNLAANQPAGLCCNPFLRDRAKGTTTLLNVSSDGTPGNGPGLYAFIADNGRVVTFSSAATSLVANPTNGGLNTYVRDLRSGHVTLVSVGAGGAPADHSSLPAFNGISATGRFVAYASNSDNIDSSTGTGHLNLFFYDLALGVTEVETVGPHGEPGDAPPATSAATGIIDAAITPSGRYIAFDSLATNLVAGDTNGKQDVFVRDRGTHRTELVSVAANGGPGDDDSLGPFVGSGAGEVAFSSLATNLVGGESLSGGRYRAYLWDRQNRHTYRISRAADGGDPDGDTLVLNMSSDRPYVLLWSTATDLVAGTTTSGANIFLLDRAFGHDLGGGKVTLVSVSASGQAANGGSDFLYGDLSHDGKVIVFGSNATNLVRSDPNGPDEDVFARVLNAGKGPDVAAPITLAHRPTAPPVVDRAAALRSLQAAIGPYLK